MTVQSDLAPGGLVAAQPSASGQPAGDVPSGEAPCPIGLDRCSDPCPNITIGICSQPPEGVHEAPESADLGLPIESSGPSPAELRRIVELMPDATLVVDRHGCLVLTNTQADRMFGYDAGELVGRPVATLLPEACRGMLTRLVAAFVATPADRPVWLELFGERRGGVRFPVEVSVRSIGAGPDEGLLLLSTVRDGSEHRRTADVARLRMAALVDSASLGIVSTGVDGRIASWNGGATAVLGWTEAEMLGTTIARLVSGPPHPETAELLARLGSGEELGASLDLVLAHRDGREVQLAMTVSPIIDQTRRVIGHSLVFQDITARKQIEVNLAQAKERAENTSREFEAFSYAVAHDLRAPLRAIDGFSQALLEDYPEALDHAGQEYLVQVCASAKYMAQLIDSLLSLARLTHGGVEVEPVDLSALARESIRRLQADQSQREVDVVIADGVLGRGDPAMLGLVLDNLLGNAWKYTRPRESARIEFGSFTDGEGTTYFVKDNGVGFDMAYSGKLFGVFQRLHAVEAFEGTGIGLATARKVLQRHGGRIWAQGEVGLGATFFFTLNAPAGSSGQVPPPRSG